MLPRLSCWFLFFMVWWVHIGGVTSTRGPIIDGSTRVATTVIATTATGMLPDRQRPVVSSFIFPNESTVSAQHHVEFQAFSVRGRVRASNSIHPERHRRTRSVRGVFYWGAVYTILFGGALTMFSLLWYVMYLCPACCYRTNNNGCDGDVNMHDTNDDDDVDNDDHGHVSTKKTPDAVEPTFRHGWWYWYWWWNQGLRFVSSSDRTRSTDTTLSNDSVSVRPDEEVNARHEDDDDDDGNVGRSLPIDDDDDDHATIIIQCDTEQDPDTNTTSGTEMDDGTTTDRQTTTTTIWEDGDAHQYCIDDDDDIVDHTIMVDVYRHYVYKSGDDDDDTYHIYG